MRIALCLEYPLDFQGGVSVLCRELARGLAARGHEVVLVSPDSAESLRASGAEKFLHQHLPWNPARPSRAAAQDLAAQLAEARPDVAHFHLGGTYGWGNRFPFSSPVHFAARRGMPCVSTVHLVVSLFDGFCGPQKPAWFKALLLPLAWWGKCQQLGRVRAEIAVSQHDFQKLRRWYWPARNRFVQVYHSRLPSGPAEGSVPREPVILNVGHIAWRKGQLVLAEAFARVAARHPEWKLLLAGSDDGGPTLGQIRDLAQRHGLGGRIVLLGERADALQLMRRAAIYVQPSYWEALGLALQEAMFCGCAALGSRAGGIPELIEDGSSGLLFEPGNVTQLAAQLERLIQNPARREQLGRAAAASIRARGMTADGMVARHLELYESIRR